MPTATLIQRRYTRDDPNGHFPPVTTVEDIDLNRLAAIWRPVIDMSDSAHAPMRLRVVSHLSQWLAEPEAKHRSWFAIIGIPGLRQQVLRHAGLSAYQCATPAGLPEHLRTPQWTRLVELIERFDQLDDSTRTLVVFQLAQLSYCHYASDLAGDVQPTGSDEQDRYAYEVARIAARVPGRAPRALDIFAALASTAEDPRLALAACSQGIGHSIRSGAGVEAAERFDEYAVAVMHRGLGDDWHSHLVLSRFHRAVALLRLAQRRHEEMREEVDAAVRHDDRLRDGELQGADRLIADENLRIILESKIKAAARARGEESAAVVRQLCAQLNTLDPNCVEARLVVGDGHAAIQDWTQAAHWYQKAGELGTGAGAIGWFRAAQCHDLAGDPAAALNAMGHCLELDTTAVEPRARLSAAAGHAA